MIQANTPEPNMSQPNFHSLVECLADVQGAVGAQDVEGAMTNPMRFKVVPDAGERGGVTSTSVPASRRPTSAQSVRAAISVERHAIPKLQTTNG